MKAVILAGGQGSRLSEETYLKPKPMVEIGNMPILWHIMKIYSSYGIKDFVICAGYKGYLIKEYFANYFLHNSDVTFNLKTNQMDIHNTSSEDWKVTIIDTGENSQTGGRLKRAKDYINGTFCFTYGDGLADIDIKKLIEFHKSQNKIATMSVVQPPGRYGSVELKDNNAVGFKEKPLGDGGWINGGFFVLEPKALDFIEDDSTSWEEISLPNLANKKELCAYKHSGFWRPMDNLRDKTYLEALWDSKNAPWKVW